MSAQDNLNEGQFSTWYHGTTAEQAQRIQSHGLTSTSYGAADSGTPWNTTITTRRQTAEKYASPLPGATDEGAVVEIHVPHDVADEYLVKHPHDLPRARLAGLKKPIPPSMIHKVG